MLISTWMLNKYDGGYCKVIYIIPNIFFFGFNQAVMKKFDM